MTSEGFKPPTFWAVIRIYALFCTDLKLFSDTYIQEDQPLFIQDKPVVIAFNNSEERAEYNEADAIRKAEMEKELRVDVWS